MRSIIREGGTEKPLPWVHLQLLGTAVEQVYQLSKGSVGGREGV